MASNVVTIFDQESTLEDYMDLEFQEEVKKALDNSHPFWNGVQWFLDWSREAFAAHVKQSLMKSPEVSRWAVRISCTVSDLVFTVLGTLVNSLRLVFSGPGVWKKAHAAALKAWEDNEERGLLAQAYAYGKKMAAYFLEIVKQCLERAIKARGLQLSVEEIDEISSLLDKTIKN